MTASPDNQAPCDLGSIARATDWVSIAEGSGVASKGWREDL